MNYKFIKLQPFITGGSWWTVILMKAAVAAETSTNLTKGCNLMNL